MTRARLELTVAKATMQLILGKKGHPIDTVLLIRSQVGLDGDRNHIRLNFAIVQQLRQKVSLGLSFGEHVLTDTGRFGDAGLNHEKDLSFR